MILELCDDVVCDHVSLSFGQPFFQAADDLSRPHQGVGNRVLKDLSSGHIPMRTYREREFASR